MLKEPETAHAIKNFLIDQFEKHDMPLKFNLKDDPSPTPTPDPVIPVPDLPSNDAEANAQNCLGPTLGRRFFLKIVYT